MNKIKFLRHKHIYIKLACSLALIISALLLILSIRNGSTLLIAGSSILLALSATFFVLSLLTKTIKYQYDNRVFYLCVGIFFHALTSRRHLLDTTFTFWFGKNSLYYEFDKLEVEAKLGTFMRPTLTVNNEAIARAK